MNVVRNLVQSLGIRNLRSATDLNRAGLIQNKDIDSINSIAQSLPISITPHLAELIEENTSSDPIARQFVPDLAEATISPEELQDPIGDNTHSPVPGVIHRYPDRVLLTPVKSCPVYCRYCFRRDVVGSGLLDQAALEAALDYIGKHREIWEVILSGGAPLILSPRRLENIIDTLDAMEHVEIIRLHTRVPVADPGRINQSLVNTLKRKTPIYVALHCNHARELSPKACTAIALLVDSGLPILSQTVLLKGVNDDPDTMADLMRALVRNRVKPYYLHHCDLARGTSHFRTAIATGQDIMRRLRGSLSGIAQPTYVIDIPGGFGKVPIGPNYIKSVDGNNNWTIKDWKGQCHQYPDVN